MTRSLLSIVLLVSSVCLAPSAPAQEAASALGDAYARVVERTASMVNDPKAHLLAMKYDLQTGQGRVQPGHL